MLVKCHCNALHGLKGSQEGWAEHNEHSGGWCALACIAFPFPVHTLPPLSMVQPARCKTCRNNKKKVSSGSQHAAAAWLLGGAPASSLAPAALAALSIVSWAVDQACAGQQALPLPSLIQLLQGRQVGRQSRMGMLAGGLCECLVVPAALPRQGTIGQGQALAVLASDLHTGRQWAGVAVRAGV